MRPRQAGARKVPAGSRAAVPLSSGAGSAAATAVVFFSRRAFLLLAVCAVTLAEASGAATPWTKSCSGAACVREHEPVRAAQHAVAAVPARAVSPPRVPTQLLAPRRLLADNAPRSGRAAARPLCATADEVFDGAWTLSEARVTTTPAEYCPATTAAVERDLQASTFARARARLRKPLSRNAPAAFARPRRRCVSWRSRAHAVTGVARRCRWW
jgi:hypothetical protein